MRLPPRPRERIELLAYVRAIPLLIMNPVLLLGPLLVGIIDQIISRIFTGSTDSFLGIASLLVFLLDTVGLAVSIIVADMIWRHGKASFDEAWDDTRRKIGDLLLAAIGLNFVLSIAFYAGSIITDALADICAIVACAIVPMSNPLSSADALADICACVFLIYTVAAAAISGIPGSAALQRSIDLVRAAPINAVILTIVTIVSYRFLSEYPLLALPNYGTTSLVIQAACKAIALGYVALIMAQRYNDLSP